MTSNEQPAFRMNYTTEQLYGLLPAIYRQRDAELDYPLRALVEVIAEQATVLERDIAQLYDNWFIETCDEWVVPYLGDLIGVRGVHPTKFSRRAEVANTIGNRRRKGTAPVLEQLARDTTNWNARVVEFFELLETTQHFNHVRPHNHHTPDLRRGTLLEYLNGPFDTIAHTAEVRRIENRRGRYNIPHLGIFLWRLGAYPLTDAAPHQVDGTGLHYTFSVLGNDAPLFNHPVTETGASHLAEEINVPEPIRRRGLHENPGSYYGPDLSIEIIKDNTVIPLGNIIACDLSNWTRQPPAGKVTIDPVLGRLAFAAGEAPGSSVKVRYYYGFSADMGGGEYERTASLTAIADETDYYSVGAAEIGKALQQATTKGKPLAVIEIKDSGTYSEAIIINIPQNQRLEIRAANEKRPALLLTSEMQISSGANSRFELNGLLIANYPLRVSGQLGHLRLQHCTLVPGRSLQEDGAPSQPSAPSLIIAAAEPEVIINHCILGSIRSTVDTEVEITDTILDANAANAFAYAALDGAAEGGILKIARSTVIGKIHTYEMRLGENSIFFGVVTARSRQQGCMRFSYAPPGSLVSKRYRCQPTFPADASPEEKALIAAKVSPQFTSLRYGHPGYGQLTPNCPAEIRRGAEDESEMGAFSSLQQSQREDNLRVRFEEYVRFGLEAGIFYVT